MARSSSDPKNLAANATTRAKLVRAAADEFMDSGFFATDSNKIAKRAALSPGSFYRHFADKLDVFCVVFETLTGEEADNLALEIDALERQGMGMIDLAHAFTDALIESRKRLSGLRAQAEILMRTEPAVRDVKVRVRQDAVRRTGLSVLRWSQQAASDDVLHVHMHVINGLADALANGEFHPGSARDACARKELTQQLIRCLPKSHQVDLG